MPDKKREESRRKLLKKMAMGGSATVVAKAMPESWGKPVVNAVMLPAHAETTDQTGSGGPSATTTPVPCCEGIVCELDWSENAPIGGTATLANCSISFEGTSLFGPWSGSGPVAADGTFSFQVLFMPDGPEYETLSGTVNEACGFVSGSLTGWPDFSGVIVASESACTGL